MTNKLKPIDLLYFKGKINKTSFILNNIDKADKNYKLDILISINI